MGHRRRILDLAAPVVARRALARQAAHLLQASGLAAGRYRSEVPIEAVRPRSGAAPLPSAADAPRRVSGHRPVHRDDGRVGGLPVVLGRVLICTDTGPDGRRDGRPVGVGRLLAGTPVRQGDAADRRGRRRIGLRRAANDALRAARAGPLTPPRPAPRYADFAYSSAEMLLVIANVCRYSGCSTSTLELRCVNSCFPLAC